MPKTLRSLLMPALVLTGVTGVTVVGIGCGPPPEVEEAPDDGCGPNSGFSEEHGHCHCDDGFEIQGTACLPVAEDDEERAPLNMDDAIITGQSTTDGQGDAVYIVQAVAGDVVLRLEGYVGFGAPETPAVVAIDDDETSYASCAVCVIVQTGCAAHDNHFHCSETLMPAAAGQVEFSTLDLTSAMAGTLHDLTFQPVAIADDNETTPLEGQRLHLSHWAFSTALVNQ